jgi:tetratricopeptide (TPR) repeat protein
MTDDVGDAVEGAFQQAVAQHQAGRLAEAERSYRGILLAHPEEPRALHLLGVIALQTGHLHDSEVLLRRALAQRPRFAEAYSNLGLVLAATSRMDEASAIFAQAIEFKPDYAEAHHNLGLARECAGDVDAAIALYRRAVELKPDYGDALCNLAIALHACARQAEAVPLYQRALLARPGLERLGLYLGAALSELGDTAGAQAAFDAALQRTPDDPLVYFCRADSAYQRGDVDAALDLLRPALQHLGASPMIARPADPVEAAPKRYGIDRYPEALRASTQKLAAAGIDAFLIGGTLLAARREGTFFAHDKDIDLAVMSEVTPAMLDQALADDPDFARTTALADDVLLPNYWFKDCVAVDVFRFFRQGDKFWCGIPVNGRILQWLHRPFRLIETEWLGVRVNLPEDPDHFLTECYGDWRTPNPYFAMWASPNLVGGFPPVARCLAYGQIFRAAFTGQRDKALSLCAQALALDPTDRLVRSLRDSIQSAPAQSTPAQGRDPRPSAEAALMQSLGHAFEDLPG